MANYHEMDRDALTAEKAALEQAYKEFQAKGLKLNMARGNLVVEAGIQEFRFVFHGLCHGISSP